METSKPQGEHPYDVACRKPFPGISAAGRAAQAWKLPYLPAEDMLTVLALRVLRFDLLRLLRRRRRSLTVEPRAKK